MGNLEVLNEKCGTRNDIVELTSFTTAISGLIIILAVPLNAFIIYSLLKERKEKFTLFFKLLFNITICDFLTGIFVSPLSLNTHLKETLNADISIGEVYMIHISLFFTDAVALLTLTVLSIDRFICIAYPIRHFHGLNHTLENLLTFSMWPLGAALVAPYFKLMFIGQLALLCAVQFVIAIVSLVVTILATRHKLYKRSNFISKKGPQLNSNNNNCKNNIYNRVKAHGITAVTGEAKVTKAFRWMIFVFIVSYFPTAVTMIYMNACKQCDCVAVHVMRDLSIILILASSVLRPIFLIMNLKHLRNSFMVHIRCKEHKESSSIQRERELAVEVFVIEPNNGK